jgi:hypothetical protein
MPNIADTITEKSISFPPIQNVRICKQITIIILYEDTKIGRQVHVNAMPRHQTMVNLIVFTADVQVNV